MTKYLSKEDFIINEIRKRQKKNDKRHHKTTNKRWHNHFK